MAFETRPPLNPPGAATTTTNDKKSAKRLLAWLFVFLLSGALAVVFVLPGLMNPSTESSRLESAVPDSPGDATPVDTQTARKRAEQGLQQALRLQAELKLANAPGWGEPQWSQVSVALAAGDRLFGERRFGEAAQRYESAVTLLRSLRDGRPQRLQQALEAAQQALEDGRIEDTIALYEQALLIEADHPQALQGLTVARARPQVLELMHSAEQAAENGDVEAGIAALRAVLELDATFLPAQRELQKLEQKKADTAFRQSMNAALAALQRGQFTRAQQALDAAAEVDAQHPSLLDARRQLALARQQAALQSLRRDTQKLTRAEDWNAAVKAYRRALKIDSNAGFARQGLALAEKRAALNRQFDHYLNNPARLYSADPLANAESLLAAVSDIPPAEPKLQAKRQRLEQLVVEARQPLAVHLRSDGQTEVVIYHVGRLGRFTDHVLQLKPGTYTAVGSRSGFRDVRRVFTLEPGQTRAVVEIRCEEPV